MAIQTIPLIERGWLSTVARKLQGRFAGELRAMGQSVDRNGLGKFAASIAVVVISQLFVAIGTAAVLGYLGQGDVKTSVEKLDHKFDVGFCLMNLRIDELQHRQPRECRP